MYWLDSAYEAVSRFMEMGGDVLWLIAALLFVMWTLIFERVWYFKAGWKKDVGKAIATWESRPERKSWEARQIREKLISEARLQINQ
jgi:biopolymer transport protein ExbB